MTYDYNQNIHLSIRQALLIYIATIIVQAGLIMIMINLLKDFKTTIPELLLGLLSDTNVVLGGISVALSLVYAYWSSHSSPTKATTTTQPDSPPLMTRTPPAYSDHHHQCTVNTLLVTCSAMSGGGICTFKILIKTKAFML